jgi:hypothetical protein
MKRRSLVQISPSSFHSRGQKLLIKKKKKKKKKFNRSGPSLIAPFFEIYIIFILTSYVFSYFSLVDLCHFHGDYMC